MGFSWVGRVIICLIIVKMFNYELVRDAGKSVKDVFKMISIAVLHFTDSGPPYMRVPLKKP
jgi:hypothetical protein